MITENGFDNMTWFMGLVEDNRDPLGGRVRVRAFGFHPPFSEGKVLTEDLPWAHILRDSKLSSMPDCGDLVMGFFLDGRDAQHPIVMGVINSAKYSVPTTKYGPPSPQYAVGGGAAPVRTGSAVNTSLQPHQRAFLDAIASKESGGAYNIRYDGGAGTMFDLSTGQHPNVPVPIGNGQYSTAAGRYQFTYSTWQDVSGGAPFTPENQDYYAWQLAEQRFPGDLNSYLLEHGVDQYVLNTLQPTWSSFNSANAGSIIATYNQSLGKTPEQIASENAQFENVYMAPSQDSVNNIGNAPMPPEMSGENIHNTPLLVQASARKTVQFGANNQYTIAEPSVPMGGGSSTSVWSMYHGGSHIVISGKAGEAEHINISHKSGSRVTLDSNGNVTIKAFSTLHTASEGGMEETSSDGKIAHHKGFYTVHVAGGKCEIYSEGDMKLASGGNIEINAAGKLNLVSGDVLNVSGSKVAMTAQADAIDLVAAGKIGIASAKTGLAIMSVDPIYIQSKNGINVKAKGTLGLTSSDGDVGISAKGKLGVASSGGDVGIKGSNVKVKGDKIHLNSPGEDPDDVADVPDALAAVKADAPEAGKLGTPGAGTETKGVYSGLGISADMIDEGSSFA